VRVCANCGAQLSPTGKFCSECAHPAGQVTPSPSPRFGAPEAYTPKHLAERILTSKSALEGERKQVTILFADLRGSMELLADRDPEDARRLLDPVLEHMMEAVHRYEGTVNQVMGDGIMGEACLLADRIDDAVTFAGRALRLARERGQRGYEAWALHLLGEIAAHPGSLNSGDSEGHYRAALALAGELGMRPLVAHCHLGLGKLYRRMGQREQAHEHLTTATPMYREMDMRYWLEQAEADQDT
jgi:tetratricopeptide (TPR) repeat protein